MNRLSHSASPYLLQHQDNPVHWWPWDSAAFAEAKARNVPVLLSVGYAACHWCHVMAHESFENTDIAAVMNDLFVCIKVDREDRPDVDHIYMSALHALGEQGGWPLTMFLTPDAEPFWGGTYFPPAARYGGPSFPDILRNVSRIFHQEPEKVRGNARALRAVLSASPRTGEASLGEAELDQVAGQLLRITDARNGGLEGAPKFPNPTLLEVLWRASDRTGDPRYRDRVLLTLDRMVRGGIYDQIGGGFSRYAVDERWLVPHFEKMLYDNAQLLELLTLAWRHTADAGFETAIRDTVLWLEREMTIPGGAFCASLDADSDGHEGLFYIWTPDEIAAVLGEDDQPFGQAYGVTAEGNFEGRTILNRLDTSETDPNRWTRQRERLLQARAARVRPGLDDKILADWNGLMIGALVRAGVALGEAAWIDMAERAYRFIAESMEREGVLGHSWREGRLVHPGFALDHAAMARAGAILHEARPQAEILSSATRYAEVGLQRYRDAETGVLAMTGGPTGEAEADLIARPSPTHDDAVPNANGVMIEALLRLAGLTGDEGWRREADALLQANIAAAAKSPLGHGGVLNMLDFRLRGAEIRLVGTSAELRSAALAEPFLNRIVRQDAGSGPASAMVCAGERCSLPVKDAAGLEAALRDFRAVRADAGER